MLLFFCFCKYTLYFSIHRTLIVFLSYQHKYLTSYINSNFIIGRKITQLRGEKNFLFSQSKKQTKMMKLFQNNTPSNQPLPQGSVPPPPNSRGVASSTLARSPTCYFLATSLLTPCFFIFLTTRSAQVLAKKSATCGGPRGQATTLQPISTL